MRVGIIGDTHLPYELDGYLEFCQEQFDLWNVDTVVHIGDFIDNHSLSFHDSEPLLHNVHGEYESALERAKRWYDAFPNVTLILATTTASLHGSYASWAWSLPSTCGPLKSCLRCQRAGR